MLGRHICPRQELWLILVSVTLMIGSKAGNSAGGYFSVPRAVMAMRMAGLKREEIEQVTWENPKRFFKLPLG